VWTPVGSNAHNTQFGLEGGDGTHYYHLSAAQYAELASGGEDYLTPPSIEVGTSNNVLFSDGDGGTFTNGIKTNEYDQFDVNFNRIKNSIIDCGAFYG